VKLILKIFNFVVFPVTIIIGLLLMASGQVASFSPKINSFLPLIGLAFPVLFALNLCFLVYWLIQLKWKSLIPAAFFLFNLGQMSLYFQWNSEPDFQSRSQDLCKVISYNANLFGAFSDSWQQDSVIEIIQTENADVVCLQEVYAKNETMISLFQRMKKRCNYQYGVVYKLTENRPYGMMILSKHPIHKWKRISFGENTGNMAMWVDVKLHSNEFNTDKTIRIYNIHLQSFRFNKSDYKTIENVNSNKELDKEQTDGLISRMKLAYAKRADQTEILTNNLAECKIPKIVVGDFNDVPASHTYRKVCDGLGDAFVKCGRGLERTYKGPFPSFRIDYILFSDPMTCIDYNSRLNVPGDHKLVSSIFKIDQLFY
jgi:endonuclease/exonuclease/phosphatase family metal-dependent hydrolase